MTTDIEVQQYGPELVTIDKSVLYEVLNRLKAVEAPKVEYHQDQIEVAQRAIREIQSQARESTRVLRRAMGMPND